MAQCKSLNGKACSLKVQCTVERKKISVQHFAMSYHAGHTKLNLVQVVSVTETVTC